MDYYYGGFAGLPPQTPTNDVQIRFNRDAVDSANQTITYWTYVDSLLADSGRAAIAIDPNYASWFTLTPDVLGWFGGSGIPIHFRSFNDSIEFTHFYIADDFYYVFGRDSCFPNSIPVPPDTTLAAHIDSIIQLLEGCWRLEYFFGGIANFPPTPPTDDQRIKFEQQSQDSVFYWTYVDSVVVDSAGVVVTLDTAIHGIYYALGNNGLFKFHNDSLIFTHHGTDPMFSVYARDSCIEDTISVPPDTTSSANVDSLIRSLTGCLRFHAYESWGQMHPADTTVYLRFSQDAQDSLNHTVTYHCYLDSLIIKTDHTSITPDTNGIQDYDGSFVEDVLGAVIGAITGTIRDQYPTDFYYFNDTLKMWDFTIAVDAPYYYFVRDSCLSDTAIVNPPDTTDFATIDSIIRVLDGCWKWDHYFGGFAGLPITPADSDVKIEFSQDAQDSVNHTISCQSFQDSVLQFSGNCSIDDSTALPYFLLSCPIFDSIGIVGSPPLYFHFEGDTLLFPQQEFVDGFVYGFLRNCMPDDTTSLFEPDEDFIHVYPNPAYGEVIVISHGNVPLRISLFNVVGQQFVSVDKIVENKFAVDLRRLSQGNYFLRIETPDAVVVRKFMIQR